MRHEVLREVLCEMPSLDLVDEEVEIDGPEEDAAVAAGRSVLAALHLHRSPELAEELTIGLGDPDGSGVVDREPTWNRVHADGKRVAHRVVAGIDDAVPRSFAGRRRAADEG